MATISAFGSSLVHCRVLRVEPHCCPSLSLVPPSASRRSYSLSVSQSREKKTRWRRRRSVVMAVAEEKTLVHTEEEEEKEPVSVPISPSDMLTMFFKAEGMMDESSVSKVSKALEEIEGISDLRIKVSEGVAIVELTKQTTVQATGVASNLVEVIQGSGFKLNTLSLSFEDEEDAID